MQRLPGFAYRERAAGRRSLTFALPHNQPMKSFSERSSWRCGRGCMVLWCLLAAVCTGCASYFRSGERTIGELESKHQAAEQERDMWFTPGEVIYSR